MRYKQLLQNVLNYASAQYNILQQSTVAYACLIYSGSEYGINYKQQTNKFIILLAISL